MKHIKTMLISTILLSQVAFADNNKYEEGESLYKTNCAACHGGMGGMDETKRIAPPIAAVRMHYIKTYSDEDSFEQAGAGWVEKQDESKSMMRGAIRKFIIMPTVNVSNEDAEKIAAYIFAGNIEEPKGFKEHVEKEHGKQGKGHGKKKNMD
jgi:cytochrome c553